MRWIWGVLVSLMVAGAVAATDLPSDKINEFKVGETTKAEVLASLGAPTFQSHIADGRSSLLYSYSPPPMNKAVTEMVVAFVFDPNGVLMARRFYGKNATPTASAAPSPATPAPAPLKDENVLAPLPDGFKIGFEATQGRTHMVELVPNGETVNDWSRLVTQQTFLGLRNVDPDALPSKMSASWTSACPGGRAEALSKAEENGYPASVWSFVCPLNPATNKPETMWIKVVGDADNLYAVQYAYRRAYSEDMTTPTLDYLRRVTVCDTRAAQHPCPTLTPAKAP